MSNSENHLMIKRIKIRDFKSIRSLELQLGPVTVLVGRSGTGKSNIMQAIRFMRNLLLRFDDAIAYEYGWECIVPAGISQPQTAVEIEFGIRPDECDYTYGFEFGTPPNNKFPGPVILTAEYLRLGGEDVFSRKRENGQWVWQKPPNMVPLPQLQDRLMLGQMPVLQEVVFANAVLSKGIGYYHFPASALGYAIPPEHGRILMNVVPGLTDTAANYRDIIAKITQDFDRPEIRKSLTASLRKVNPSIQSIELDSLDNPQTAIVAHTAGNSVFALDLEQESDGLRRFYAHLLALYQTPRKLALVFEEPENAIFPGALSLLAEEFKAAPREQRGQVILTTHSPMLLDAFDVQDIRVVEMHDGQTIVGPVAADQRDAVERSLLRTGELLTSEPARAQTASVQGNQS